MSSQTFDRITATASVAGAMIRYSFYLVGMLVFAFVGYLMMYGWRAQPTPVDSPPALEIAASQLSHLPVSGHVIRSGRFGRIEVRQYGKLHNREVDLAVVMVMPPKGIGMGTEFAQDLREINLLRGARAVLLGTHHDLETRFGEFRATDMRVETDGRWKQCLAYRSRLDTAAVYLTGWYCDASGAKPSAGALACMLDRLTLRAELASKEADGFLRARMAQSAQCSGTPVSQTPDTGGRRMSSPQRWSQPSSTQPRR